MKSYLLSSLAAKYRAVELAKFEERHRHHWLLWEPGAWTPPKTRTITFQAMPASRRSPVKAAESLALALEEKAQLTLGRDATCDLVINDGTLSGKHLLFHFEGQGWSVEDAGSRNGALVEGVKLAPRQRVPLGDGAKIVAAQVVLTFYTPASMWARLRS